jgi:hypothetical protein
MPSVAPSPLSTNCGFWLRPMPAPLNLVPSAPCSAVKAFTPRTSSLGVASGRPAFSRGHSEGLSLKPYLIATPGQSQRSSLILPAASNGATIIECSTQLRAAPLFWPVRNHRCRAARRRWCFLCGSPWVSGSGRHASASAEHGRRAAVLNAVRRMRATLGNSLAALMNNGPARNRLVREVADVVRVHAGATNAWCGKSHRF